MSFSFDRQTSFALEGSRWRRLNPDGSYPTIDRQLGFSGTVDLSALIATSELDYREEAQGAFTSIEVGIKEYVVDFLIPDVVN